MKLIVDNDSVAIPFGDLPIGQPFMLDQFLWLKNGGDSPYNGLSLEDNPIVKTFSELTLVSPVKITEVTVKYL